MMRKSGISPKQPLNQLSRLLLKRVATAGGDPRPDYLATGVHHQQWAMEHAAALVRRGDAMKWIQVEEQWKVYEGSARAHWSKLDDHDWQTATGNKEQLIGRIQERYGISKDEAGKQVEDWARVLLEIRAAPATGR